MDAPGDRDARDVDDNLVGRFRLERRKRRLYLLEYSLEKNSFSGFRASGVSDPPLQEYYRAIIFLLCC